MPAPVNRVAEVAEFLARGRGTPKEKLVIGGKMLRAAMMFAEDWTPGSLAKAKETLATLTKDGSLEKTVAGMDKNSVSNALDQLTKVVTGLAEGIEQPRGRKRR
jgi:hypothetical protein